MESMNNKTVQYKRTLRGSVGAGVNALFNGNGRRYYILEHKDASKYHKAGESQKIIIDQIELGRDSNCQVRFDETFSTVSRRHAAIMKDGERWKLVQLSKTNSTLLNGRPIETECYLENGDEIQLSVGGPRMGFIVPAGKQSLVSSIKMTERLDLFRKQALKPYKTAIACLFALFIFCSAVAGYIINNQDKQIADLFKQVDIQINLTEDIRRKAKEDSTRMAHKMDSISKIKPKTIIVDKTPDIAKAVSQIESSVFTVITTIYVSNQSEVQKLSSSQGTGFLLSDGRFVTARHCVEPWMYDLGEKQAFFAMSRASDGIIKIWAEIFAINMKGEKMNFKSTDFTVDRSYDAPNEVDYELNGEHLKLPGSIAFGTTASLGNDWAYVTTSNKGTILDGKDQSAAIKKGTEVHLLGFPRSLGILDGTNIVEPIYNKMSVSRTGLNNGRCIMVSEGIDHGNSGGPVFIYSKGNLYVVGIVSRGDSNSDHYNHLVPMSNLK